VSRKTPKLTAVASAILACCALFGAAAAPAGATVASETVTSGSLSFISSTPGPITFPATVLNGSDQVKTQTQPFDVSDASGSNAGWAITATSTTLKSGANSMSPTATTIQSAPTDACDAASTCTLASNAITYPYSLPAAATAPVATKMYNAAVNTGMGNQTVTPNWSLAVPATTVVGTYTSTWTFTLVSGP
jgi:hypothetical protein